jgi:hypothetical protein
MGVSLLAKILLLHEIGGLATTPELRRAQIGHPWRDVPQLE